MARNLFEHGQINTTLAKAKTLRPYVERLITLAVRTRKLSADSDTAGALRARRRIYQLLGDRGIIPKDHRDTYAAMSDAHRAKTMRMSSGRRYRTGEPKGRLVFTAESVTHRLIDTIAPRFDDRPGGYTRLVRLANRRLGDNSPLAVLQLIGEEEAPVSLTKPRPSARKRRADARYAMAIKVAKPWTKKGQAAQSEDEGPRDEGSEAEADASTDVTDNTHRNASAED